jgi:N utilization substance protein A
VNELGGEKVDVVEWSDDPAQFVANALSPAQVVSVECDTVNKTATVVVPDLRLSLAIGKQGQNARLAAKLTGWRIDIKSVSAAAAEALMAPPQPAPAVEVIPAPDLPELEEAAPAGAVAAEAAPVEAREPVTATAPVWDEPKAPTAEEEAEEEEEFEAPVVIELPKAAAPVSPLPTRIRFAEEIRGLERRTRAPRPEEAEGTPARRRARRVRPQRDDDDDFTPAEPDPDADP